MAFKMKGFPTQQVKSAFKKHMDIPKDKDPEGWAMYHAADGTPRPTEHVKKIVQLMNQGMTANEAIAAVGKKDNETKENN